VVSVPELRNCGIAPELPGIADLDFDQMERVHREWKNWAEEAYWGLARNGDERKYKEHQPIKPKLRPFSVDFPVPQVVS
jgi:hypothetical protein